MERFIDEQIIVKPVEKELDEPKVSPLQDSYLKLDYLKS